MGCDNLLRKAKLDADSFVPFNMALHGANFREENLPADPEELKDRLLEDGIIAKVHDGAVFVIDIHEGQGGYSYDPTEAHLDEIDDPWI